jgi:S-adenosylmethionine synthetase
MRTAEAVSPGHPDKIADQISDAILDAYLTVDPDARVAVEVMGGHGKLYICGEVTSKVKIDKSDIYEIAKEVYWEIGYKDKLKIQVNIVNQSPDIAQGVDTGGAGDQGIMVGYACNDNEEMIPQELYLARKILKEVLALGYGPDGKSQVTLDDNGKISRLVVSVQHKEEDENIRENILCHLTKIGYDVDHYNLIVNSTGKFVIGGFEGDTGLTGRKIVQDAYGPQVPVGGGAFSGKDPSKVDRSAAYMARKIAVDLLKKYNLKEITVKIAYSIGIKNPLMADVKASGPTPVKVGVLTKELSKYDLTPQGIINFLDLKQPIYRKTAEWGAFGTRQRWDE